MDALDHLFWSALSGSHKALSVGTDRVRRYAPGLPNLLAFADPRQPALRDLEAFCTPGERFYCTDWRGTAPPGWRVDLEAELALMVWDGSMPVDSLPGMVQLRDEHRPAAQRLVEITQPGPFGARAFELGDYLGWIEQGQLVAMAGERLHAERFREISAVCTHPDFRARGLAGRLVQELVRRQLARGETPFLHVLVTNQVARSVYRALGFRDHRISPVRVVSMQG